MANISESAEMRNKICNSPTKWQLQQILRQVSTEVSKHLASMKLRHCILLLLVTSVYVIERVFSYKNCDYLGVHSECNAVTLPWGIPFTGTFFCCYIMLDLWVASWDFPPGCWHISSCRSGLLQHFNGFMSGLCLLWVIFSEHCYLDLLCLCSSFVL